MKKAFSLLIVVLLTSAMWFKASASEEPPIKTTVYSEFFTDVAAGKYVPAKFFANDHFQNLNCVATAQPGYVLCEFSGELEGKQVTIEFTKNKVMFIYTVDVPRD